MEIINTPIPASVAALVDAVNAANAALCRGQYQMALELAGALALDAPLPAARADALALAGEALAQLGRPAEAEGAYRAALLLCPETWAALFGLALLDLDRGADQDAALCARAALRAGLALEGLGGALSAAYELVCDLCGVEEARRVVAEERGLPVGLVEQLC